MTKEEFMRIIDDTDIANVLSYDIKYDDNSPDLSIKNIMYFNLKSGDL